MPHPSPLRSTGFLIGLLLASGGCTSWRPITDPSPMADPFAVQARVRLTDSAGRRIIGSSAIARGNSILFTRIDGSWDSMPRLKATVVERRRFDAGKTLGRVSLIGVTGFIVMIVVLTAADPCLAAFC